MKYISEAREVFDQENQGLFSKRLAEWAISHMEVKDTVTGVVKPLKPRSLEDVKEVLKTNNVKMPDEFEYTAWYLFNMALADYPKTLQTDEQRAMFVDETISDVDGCPENVLDCFVAKMCNAGIPIHWEKYI